MSYHELLVFLGSLFLVAGSIGILASTSRRTTNPSVPIVLRRFYYPSVISFFFGCILHTFGHATPAVTAFRFVLELCIWSAAILLASVRYWIELRRVTQSQQRAIDHERSGAA